MLKKGDSNPEADDPNAPKVIPEAFWLWRIFNVLHAQRQFNEHGPQPLSVSDMAGIAALEDLDKADARWMVDLITTLDRIFLQETYDRMKRERNAAKNKAARTNMGAPKRGR